MELEPIIMTPYQFQQAMKKIYHGKDPEHDHQDADNLMCRVLRELGYKDGVDVFYSMEKWYS